MLDKFDAKMAADALDEAASHYGDHGCNDLELTNTPYSLDFIKRLIAASDYPEDKPHLSDDGRMIYTMDWMVMRYCADVLRKYSKGE